jgi:hypothetical protein
MRKTKRWALQLAFALNGPIVVVGEVEKKERENWPFHQLLVNKPRGRKKKGKKDKGAQMPAERLLIISTRV